jgi:hypothetical protein
MMGRSFDYHFVASHARRAYAVGHTSHDPRLECGEDDISQYREQTIVIIRDCKDGAGVGIHRTSNPIDKFNELDILLSVIFGSAYALTVALALIVMVLILDTTDEELDYLEGLPEYVVLPRKQR